MRLLLSALLATVLCTGPAVASPLTRITERVSITFGDFAYASNFWATESPHFTAPTLYDPPTLAGPAPIAEMILAIDLSYILPRSQADRVPGPPLRADAVSVFLDTIAVPGLSRAASGMATVADLRVTPHGAGNGMQLRIDALGLAAGTLGSSGGRIATNVDLRLDGLFDAPASAAAPGRLIYTFHSPIAFDAPRFASTTATYDRTVLQQAAVALVPLPAPAALLAAGLGLLAVLRRRRATA